MSKVRIDTSFRQMLPRMTEAEYSSLKANIERYGKVLEPITYWKETGIVLDGCYRLEIALELGLPYEIVGLSFPDELSAKRWRLESNLVRRHLNKYQRVILMDVNRYLYEAEAKERQGRRNDFTKKIRESNNPKGEPTEFKPNTKEDVAKAYRQKEDTLTAKEQEMANRMPRKIRRKKETNYILAQQIGISETTYRQALYIRDSNNKEIIQAVASGEMSISKAYKFLKAELQESKSELDCTKAGINKAVTQICEAYEWVLAQQFEFEGEVVTERIRQMLKGGLETMEDIALGFDSMQLRSDTGIISVVEELTNGTDGRTPVKNGLRPFSPMKRIK